MVNADFTNVLAPRKKSMEGTLPKQQDGSGSG
jgi:hypothetical protein